MNRKVTVVFYLLINISLRVTIFCSFRHIETGIMMAAMDPKPVKLQENVILKFKNLIYQVSTKAKLYSAGSVLISFNFNNFRLS